MGGRQSVAAELCGQVFEEYVAVGFGGVRQSSAGNCAGTVGEGF